jgi:ribosomal protein S19E (S16A)
MSKKTEHWLKDLWHRHRSDERCLGWMEMPKRVFEALREEGLVETWANECLLTEKGRRYCEENFL